MSCKLDRSDLYTLRTCDYTRDKTKVAAVMYTACDRLIGSIEP